MKTRFGEKLAAMVGALRWKEVREGSNAVLVVIGPDGKVDQMMGTFDVSMGALASEVYAKALESAANLVRDKDVSEAYDTVATEHGTTKH